MTNNELSQLAAGATAITDRLMKIKIKAGAIDLMLYSKDLINCVDRLDEIEELARGILRLIEELRALPALDQMDQKGD